MTNAPTNLLYHKFVLLWTWLVRVVTNPFPDMPLIMRWRGWLYGRFMRHQGRDLQVASDVRLVGLESISVGDHVYIGPGSYLFGGWGIALEDEVLIAYKVVLVSGNHTRANRSYRYGHSVGAPITIRRGAWVAAQCCVLAGVTIGEGSLIAANATVTRDIPSDVIAGGTPARVLGPATDLDETEFTPDNE